MKTFNRDTALFYQGSMSSDFQFGQTLGRETIQLYILSAYPKYQAGGGMFNVMSEYICKARTLEYHGKYTLRNGGEDWSENVNAIWQPKGAADTNNPVAGQVWEAIILDTENEGNYSLISVSGLPKQFFLKPNLEVSY